ncbi:hypothetical protein COCNU_12G003640 [Cocos nucifera]|uniref:Uncharacterized protein n=1 Tax=Cocos nucifera TaxID=13894 RepID=A0A8K0IQZ9_COCNU|nr:hypothetical protein COCNU_12G003640 [Cocos nucifera]
MLFFEGSSVVVFGIGAIVNPLEGIWSRSLLPLAYYAAVLVLFLFGVCLLKLSFVVAGNPNRHALAKAVMWATLAPLVLVIALHVLGANQNKSP